MFDTQRGMGDRDAQPSQVGQGAVQEVVANNTEQNLEIVKTLSALRSACAVAMDETPHHSTTRRERRAEGRGWLCW